MDRLPMLFRTLVRLSAALLLCLWLGAGPALAQGVAVIIGNSAYRQIGPLANPARDATAIADLMRRFGFRVVEGRDLTAAGMRDLMARAAQEHKGSEAVVVFYAGHGLQVNGRNFLVPVDMTGQGLAALDTSAVPLDEVQRMAAAIAPAAIIVLDACRDQPSGLPAAGSRGLARLDDTPIAGGETRMLPDGTLIAFATAPDTVAEDGTGANSPFTKALLRHLTTPGEELRTLMTLVREEVYLATNGRQTPWVNDGLRRLVYVAPAGSPEAPGAGERRQLLVRVARLDPAERRQVETVAGTQAVPLAAMFGVLTAFGDDARDPARIEERLLAKAGEYQALKRDLAALTGADPALADLKRQANAALAEGAFGQARVALTQAIALGRASADTTRDRVREAALGLAATLAERAKLSSIAGDYRAAAADFAEAAERVRPFDDRLAADYRGQHGLALYALAQEFGERPALDEAIGVFEEALAAVPRRRLPLEWGLAQNRLGMALSLAGIREQGSEKLEEAMGHFREALKELTPQRAREDWAKATDNLAVVLSTIGQREPGVEKLNEAIALQRKALAALDPASSAMERAITLVNLGANLQVVGKRQGSIAILNEAIRAFEEARGGDLKRVAPFRWADATGNLATTVLTLAEGTDDLAGMQRAAALFQEAQTVSTRERNPVGWATAQNNLGNTLMRMGQIGDGVPTYRRAVAVLEEALDIFTQESSPSDWAMIKVNVATVKLSIAERMSSQLISAGRQAEVRAATADDLAGSITDYEAALTIHTREARPGDWASTSMGLGNALVRRGQNEQNPEHLIVGAGVLRAVLAARSRTESPIAWAMTAYNLAFALQSLASQTASSKPLAESLDLFTGARDVFRDTGLTAQARQTEMAVQLTDLMKTIFEKQGR
jgi:uncharacterized caspase-like protein